MAAHGLLVGSIFHILIWLRIGDLTCSRIEVQVRRFTSMAKGQVRRSADNTIEPGEELLVRLKMRRPRGVTLRPRVLFLQILNLLDCMLDANLDPGFLCQEAHCGTCMVVKLRGEVNMRKNDVLSKRDLEQGYVLLCQSIPLSDDVWVDCDV
jgi:3-ketosteroid 9alpha-monooxygenase subunit B